jgi:type IV secretory pathway protease TraF
VSLRVDLSQWAHDVQPLLHRASWLLPAVAGYIAGRAAWGARRSSASVRRSVLGLTLAIVLVMPLYANPVMGVWATILVTGLAFAAVGITRQALYPQPTLRSRLARYSHRALAGVGGLAAAGALLGVASGGALVLSLGPSMWPTAPIAPSLAWLDTRAYRTSPPLPGEDIEFTVDWASGQAFRANESGWPTGRYRKRVWAVGGDTVRFTDTGLLVNGALVLDCSGPRMTSWTRGTQTWHAPKGAWWCFPDFNADGKSDHDHPMVWAQTNQWSFSGLQFNLKKGEVFVMGDNTIQSSDSREFGPIQAAWVDGRHANAKLPRGKVINDY